MRNRGVLHGRHWSWWWPGLITMYCFYSTACKIKYFYAFFLSNSQCAFVYFAFAQFLLKQEPSRIRGKKMKFGKMLRKNNVWKRFVVQLLIYSPLRVQSHVVVLQIVFYTLDRLCLQVKSRSSGVSLCFFLDCIEVYNGSATSYCCTFIKHISGTWKI